MSVDMSYGDFRRVINSHVTDPKVRAEMNDLPNVSSEMHVKMITIPVTEITPERAMALRGEMIRLAHNGLASSPEDTVIRAETYFQYITNGAKS